MNPASRKRTKMGLRELLGLKPKKDLSKCRFDNDAYWRDIENGVPYEVHMRKH